MVSVLASSAIDCGSNPGWVKLKTIKLVFVSPPLSTVSRRKSKDRLAQNQDNVSVWDDMSIHGLSFQ